MVDGDDDALDMEDNQPHVALGEEGCLPHVALGEEGCRPHVALGEDGVHCLLAHVELEVVEELVELVEELVELEEELEELDVALLVGSSALGFLLEVLPLGCAYCGCAWRWLDLILEGHVAPSRACASRCCC